MISLLNATTNIDMRNHFYKHCRCFLTSRDKKRLTSSSSYVSDSSRAVSGLGFVSGVNEIKFGASPEIFKAFVEGKVAERLCGRHLSGGTPASQVLRGF